MYYMKFKVARVTIEDFNVSPIPHVCRCAVESYLVPVISYISCSTTIQYKATVQAYHVPQY